MSKLKDIREYYYANNLMIFPLTPNDKTPLDTMSWKYLAEQSKDKKQIMYWYSEVADANVGLPASMNNLFVIDIDMHDGVNGYENFKQLLHKLNITKIDTLCQTTPSGGMHLIYKSNENLKKVKNVANAFKKDGLIGIDIRTDGYIVVYPSVINGKEYKFINVDSSCDIIPSIKEMPKALEDYIVECNQDNSSQVAAKFKDGDFFVDDKVISKGTRDEEIFNYINFLYNNTNLNILEIETLALGYNEKCFDPPLKEREVEYKVKKCFEKQRPKIIIIRMKEEE